MNISPSTRDLAVSLVCSSDLVCFQPITLPSLIEIVSSMKSATCPLDIILTAVPSDTTSTKFDGDAGDLTPLCLDRDLFVCLFLCFYLLHLVSTTIYSLDN